MLFAITKPHLDSLLTWLGGVNSVNSKTKTLYTAIFSKIVIPDPVIMDRGAIVTMPSRETGLPTIEVYVVGVASNREYKIVRPARYPGFDHPYVATLLPHPTTVAQAAKLFGGDLSEGMTMRDNSGAWQNPTSGSTHGILDAT